ncbi:hypothetical protein B5S32_g811 [[Candida] boidinii]|nr:hypothetical protein B5S32_g811 [[Candida] boidinii]
MSKILESRSVAPQPAKTLQAERENTDFDIDEMYEFLEGSKEKANLRLEIMSQLERDPVLKTDQTYYDLTKAEHREYTAKKIARLSQYLETDMPDLAKFQERLNLISIVDPQLGTRLGVHLGLFLSAIKGNGTDSQFNYWAFERGAASVRGIYGCFGMTELAHGSNVAGLETTATYDKSKREFIINTPHIGATKWWIGGAAHSATHSVCFARLIVDNKDYGVKTFVVPLRDNRHELLPGISIGDIGAKMGRDGIDNGWIQYSNVRIPKEYMLTKYSKVEDDGEVIEPPLAQLAYGALLGGRTTMVTDSFRMSERFITIALRYASIRRQFADKGKQIENQLIDYPLHQRRLIPLLALTYGMSFASDNIQTEYSETLDELDNDAKSGDFDILTKAIGKLKNLFGCSASLKSTLTWDTAKLIDECRQSCGGHGYSSYNGFGKAYNDWVVQCTWEGDNNILATSTGRIIIQNLAKYLKTGKISTVNNEFSFVKDHNKFKGDSIVLNDNKLNDLSSILDSYTAVLIRLSESCIKIINENNGNSDIVSAERVALSKIFAYRFILDKWIIKLNSLNKDSKIKPDLIKLAKILAIYKIDEFSGFFLQFKILSTESLTNLQSVLKKLLVEIRPKIIGLTDSFKYSDFFINSPIGTYNGDAYQKYFDIVKLQNNPSISKAPYSDFFEKQLHRGSIEEREDNEKSKRTLDILSK